MTDLKVAWFTPLQPVESGISLYNEDLLPILSQVMRIDAIVEGYRPTCLLETDRLRVVDYRRFRAEDYDLVVYQLGNSPPHLYMLPEISRTPGVLVLHDTVLNHLFVQQAAREGTLSQYRDEMERRYGPDGRRAADRVLKGQAPDDLFRFPMGESLVRESKATIVHSEYARREALKWSPDSDVVRVPHGLRFPEYVEREEARAALGLPPDQFILASITHVSPYKRIDVVLRAFRQLRRSVPSRLLLAGSVSPNYPIQRMIAHLGLDQVVDLLGYVADQQARLIAAAADVIVNLRYPTAGETSGSLLHSMAAGRPVLVSQTGSFTEVPEGSVIPVPVDALEEQTLTSLLQHLAGIPDLRDEVGARARRFIEREHSLQRWVDGYIDVISAISGAAIERPVANLPPEPVLAGYAGINAAGSTELIEELGASLADLGLGGDADLLNDLARATVELGLGVGKMEPDLTDRHARAGE